jgi:excisionase family DNA binding protein
MKNNPLPKGTATPSPVHEAGFATTNEAAEYLNLSKGMVFKLIEKGIMPASRYGRAVRIPWVWLRTEAGE